MTVFLYTPTSLSSWVYKDILANAKTSLILKPRHNNAINGETAESKVAFISIRMQLLQAISII